MASFAGESEIDYGKGTSTSPPDIVIAKLKKSIQDGEKLVERCKDFNSVKGISKLRKRCQAELNFVKQLSKKSVELIECHLNSTNISHLEGILEAVSSLPDVTEVMHKVSRPYPLIVDVVCCHGGMWVKVIARNAQALHLVWAGNGQFGNRNIMEQAEHYVECADQHPYHFKAPHIQFRFCNGVTFQLAEAMENLGIEVYGKKVPVTEEIQMKLDLNDGYSSDDEDEENDSEDCDGDSSLFSFKEELKSDPCCSERTQIGWTCHDQETYSVTESSSSSEAEHCSGPLNFSRHRETFPLHQKKKILTKPADSKSCSEKDISCMPDNSKTEEMLHTLCSDGIHNSYSGAASINKVNLDISSLLCLVSNVCHGRCNLIFKDEILSMMAEQERATPLLPELNQFMEGKELYACETAVSDFKSILETVGGPKERERASHLLQKVNVVPDDISERASRLTVQGKVKLRTKIVFGTGDKLQAITMTGNHGFVRAAQGQGVAFDVFMHQSRALTEQKEATAIPYVTQ